MEVMSQFNLKILLLLSCGHMVVDIYQGALPAILPFLKDRLDLSYTVAGTILIASNLTSSVIQPLFGFLSDKKEKAYLLPLGTFAAGAGFSLLAGAGHYLLILLLVAISGFGIAAYHPEGFKTARFFTGQKMATGMSVFAVGGNFGNALGPIIALSIINYFGFSSLPWMFLPAAAFTIGIIALRKSVAIPAKDRPAVAENTPPIPRRAHRAMIVIICVIIMRTWTQIGLMTYIPFYYIDVLKQDPVFAGKLVSMLLLGGAFGTLAGSPLADRWGHRLWLRFSMLGSFFLFPLIFHLQGFLLSVAVTLFGAVLISTFSVTVVMGQNLLPRNLGVASGLIVGFAIGAGGIGVTLLGILADHFGVPFAFKCIGFLPLAGFLMSLLLEYPLKKTA
ncbi:major facilitator superfamily MFS_1 [Syntrophobacter fumaroxidans MPOB]|uniref:Major facilitator superfamily MFS_1 n=2 Tax=Syntrophobacter TaxID=29526 RepID=A0LP45_SYNFM|nr:major facilitator superfamily MFS_1 [Syntrophobacter fumaroxidans MPOB]